MNKILLSIFFCFGFIILMVGQARAEGFDPNNIISDLEILDYSTMSLADIQDFLATKGSFLANYTCPDASGTTKKASEIIYNAAVNNYDCDDAVGLSENPTDEEK